MPIYEIERDGEVFEVEAADENQALQSLSQTRSGAQPNAQPNLAERYLNYQGSVWEPAAAMVTGAVAEPVAGLAGLAVMPFQGAQGAAETVQGTREALTYQPRTEGGKRGLEAVSGVMEPIAGALDSAGRYLGDRGNEIAGPIGGATGATLPTAALTLIPGSRSVRRMAGKAPEAPPRPAQTTTPPPEPGYQQIVRDIESQKAEVAAQHVRPDLEIMEAAERQGISLNPSHYSLNPTYIELEQSLKSRPGSGLQAIEAQAFRQVGERAEQLVRDLGGSLDRSVFDSNLRTAIDENVGALTRQSDALYKQVNEAVPRRLQVEAPNARAYIERTLADLGGNKQRLSPVERELLTLMDDGQPLTYAALDRLRKDIGEGFNRRGPYRDESGRILGEVYGALSLDQRAIASSRGVGDSLSAAAKLVTERKALEDRSVEIFGRDLTRDAGLRVRQSASDLSKGNATTFRRLLDNVPSNLRQDAAVAVLNDIFTLGSRTGTDVGAGFSNAFRSLRRNQGAMDALLGELPEGAAQRFTDLGRISEGLHRAKARENTSKTARDIIAALDNPGTLAKLYQTGAKVIAAEGLTTAAGIPGAGSAGVLASLLTRGKTRATATADEFVGSPQFRKAIDLLAEGKVRDADAMAMSSPAFSRWAESLTRDQVGDIATLGLLAWLSGDESSGRRMADYKSQPAANFGFSQDQ